ncbi:transglycosylase domain-containing protein [Paenibacillus sp. J2TS4]|uniref:transglycosylase domain-containing protein n=1 Tax=Paenibacillus sp. J2TS4 TaxID=2807194 RepID=UPI001B0270C3|nr:penicillin-binding protein 1A [Paenibacillus sp. J2TS4]GIP36550.1 penicillin-binding protein [Paenibacillus sp. J2TS4]
MRNGDEKSGISWMRRIRKLVSLLFSLLILFTAAIVLSLLYLRSQALPVTTTLQTSEIYDIHGELIDSFHAGQNRQIVSLNDISPYLVQAALAIEDRRFYDHFGLDPKGLARAVATNIKTMSLQQGASTITQQLARNLYLNHDRTWSRKIKEAAYALQMEMQLSKDQILEQYLNQIYYGHSTYGVQAASQLFFGKNAKDLTLGESALLAGVPKGPKYYSPFYNMDNALNRQKIILNTMVDQNLITREEADRAAQEKLVFSDLSKDRSSEAPYFQDYIRQWVSEKLKLEDSLFETGGIRIYTTLDLRAQNIAEEVLSKHLKSNEELQGALISIDPRNGHIKAMVGGKDYNTNQYNRVFTTTRQPGSSFKPFVYLAALQNGFTPVSQYKSEPTEFTYDDGKKTYRPSNFNNHYENKLIDMRRAIAKSDNIYAVQTIMDVGADQVIDLAHRMGITSPLEPLPSLALGTYPVSPYEMASAFGIIANEGVRVEPIGVLKVVNSRGKVLYEAKPKKERVIEAPYAYILTNMMQSVFEQGGTANRVSSVIKRPAAGKTGTTNNDAWMVGYTPELSTAVWVGYDRNKAITTADSYKAAPIFAEFMEKTLDPVPPKLFPIPDGVTSVYVDPDTGKLANDACTPSRLEVFVQGTEPVEYCAESKTDSTQQPQPATSNQSWWDHLKRWWND